MYVQMIMNKDMTQRSIDFVIPIHEKKKKIFDSLMWDIPKVKTITKYISISVHPL